MKAMLKMMICLTAMLALLCTAAAEPAPVEAGIYVPYIAGTEDESFIRGADVSSYLSLIRSGVVFHDFDGNALDEAGFFALLRESGVNWIRLRVWNDPFDAQGNGYGGGNNDIDAALTMGRMATDAGLRVMIDFHYSDFWADPAKQQAPKAWQGMTLEEKEAALEAFTLDSLRLLLEGGVDVGMVQLGNETNSKFCGEKDWAAIDRLLNAGSRAVRAMAAEFERDIRIALHFTNPEKRNGISFIAGKIAQGDVDYDVLAVSCYPYWHGTPENLTKVLKEVSAKYGKQVMVAETSWAWTLDDADGHGNTVGVGGNDANPAYPFSVQGQAMEVSRLTQAVREVGEAGIGLVYWEPAWIPVQPMHWGESGAEATYAQNQRLWEQFGSGWASSFAGEYDPEDAGKWYGGCAVDNQALFDEAGYPLESLRVFRYMMTGTEGFDIVITRAESFSQAYGAGETLTLPETALVSFNYGPDQQLAIAWNEAEAAALPMDTAGDYVVHGTVGDGYPVSCAVAVRYVNLLRNPGFEDEDMSMYAVSQDYAARTTDDPKAGKHSLHFWTEGIVEFTAEQTVTLAPGRYAFSLTGQGGDMGDTGVSYAYVRLADGELTADFALTGWVKWVTPSIAFEVTEETEVTVGVYVHAAKDGAWGTFDEWSVCRVP